MESNILIIVSIISAIVCLLATYNYTAIRKLRQCIPEALIESLKTLDPEKRYIITFPSAMTEEDFEEAFEVMNDHLSLEDAHTHVVIMHGKIQIVEFS